MVDELRRCRWCALGANGTTGVVDAISKGAKGEDASKEIKAALDATKEFYSSDRIGGAVQRANSKLKTARTFAKAENLQGAEQDLKTALKMFEDMRGML